VHAANHYIEDMEPFRMAKDPARAEDLAFVMMGLIESIRIAAALFEPFMPATSAEVARRLSLDASYDKAKLAEKCAWGYMTGGAPVTKGAALFPRLASEK